MGATATLTRTDTTYLAGYGRISDDDNGDGIGVDNQEHWFHQWAAEHYPGVPTRWFFDNDITGTTAERGGFEELRDAIRLGEVRGLWCRDQSRVLRNLEAFIALRKELLGAGHEYFATRDNGRVKIDDLGTTIRAAIDEDRVRQDRKHLMDRQRRDAEQGLPPNGSIFGYRSKRDAAGNLVRPRTLVIAPEQADIIREVAQRVLAGETTTAIAKDFVRRNVRGARGAAIATSTQVESVVTNPTIAGHRVYSKDLVLGDDGNPLRGNWPPILDVDTWQDVCTVIAQRRRERKASAPKGGYERRRYILSGLVRCGRCDDSPRMEGTRKPKATDADYRVYKCRRCGSAVVMTVADQVALDAVAGRLADAVGLAEAMAEDDNAGRRDEIHRALEAIEAQRAEARQDRVDELIDRAEYRDTLRRLNERRDALQAELTELVQPTSADDPDAALHALGDARTAAAEGDADAISTLRALAHEWLTGVVVAPHVRGQAPQTRVNVE